MSRERPAGSRSGERRVQTPAEHCRAVKKEANDEDVARSRDRTFPCCMSRCLARWLRHAGDTTRRCTVAHARRLLSARRVAHLDSGGARIRLRVLDAYFYPFARGRRHGLTRSRVSTTLPTVAYRFDGDRLEGHVRERGGLIETPFNGTRRALNILLPMIRAALMQQGFTTLFGRPVQVRCWRQTLAVMHRTTGEAIPVIPLQDTSNETKRNSWPLHNPLWLSLRAGVTSRAMNASVMKGAVRVEPNCWAKSMP